MIALTARLNERDETIIQLQEELDAYERIHRETEVMVDKKQDRIMHLEHIMQGSGIEVPEDEEGADKPYFHHGGSNFGDNHPSDPRKYTPHETYHLGEGDDDQNVPL